MSVTFLILPLDQNSDLKIDHQDYHDKICARWPGYRTITQASWLHSALCMEIFSENVGDFAFICDLHTDLKTVAFEYFPRETFLEYILWHRSYIPEEHPLELFGDFAEKGIELRKDTTLEEIIEYTEGE